VQHERVGIHAQLGHDERHPVGHQPGDEMHVAAQTVELRHDDRFLRLPGVGEGRRELGPPIQGVASLSRLYLAVVAGDLVAVLGAEGMDGSLLGFKAQAGLALLAGGNARVADGGGTCASGFVRSD
jgi:hypothetical protein